MLRRRHAPPRLSRRRRRRRPCAAGSRRRTPAAMLAASNELQVDPRRLRLRAGGDAARDRRGRLHGRGAGALGPRRHARVAGVRAAGVGDDGPRARHGARRDPPQRGLPRRDRVVDAPERRRARAAAGGARGRPAGGGAVLPRGVAPARPDRRARAGLRRPRRRRRLRPPRDRRRRARARARRHRPRPVRRRRRRADRRRRGDPLPAARVPEPATA